MHVSRTSRLPLFLLVVFFSLCASPSLAAEIYGQVWIAGSKAPAVDAIVSVGPKASATVDKNGNYRIRGAADGWLVMTITTKDKRGSKPLKVKIKGFTRVDIELARSSSTNDWILRRR